MTTNNDGLLDSLPYYDNDLERYPILKEKVEKELAREPKPPSSLHPQVPLPFELFKVYNRVGRIHYSDMIWDRKTRCWLQSLNA